MVYAFPLELLMGFAVAAPPRRLGERAAFGVAGFTVFTGILRGQLDPLFRAGIALASGSWATMRRISLRFVVVVLVLFVIFQPVKGAFRDQVWTEQTRTGQAPGVGDRVTAWQNAFSNDNHAQESESGSMARLAELGAVMHAFDMLPGRVDFLDGAGFVSLLTAPIPRFLWKDKPTTRDTISRYAIVFQRQTEAASATTTINLPLLVEGYWNFGWPGIVLVCVALGFWYGVSQRMFASDHWAMRATGIANITFVTVAGAVINVYSSVFQMLTGRLFVCWAIFFVAKQLSRREHERPAFVATRAVRRP
jgi:hypothetical protein